MFRFRAILKALALYGLTVFVLAFAFWCFEPEPDWLYTGQLHAMIADADRIVVRDEGHHRDSEAADACAVLFETQDAKEVEAVRENLEFEEGQRAVSCACLSYPVIEWYRGDAQLALVSLQHGQAIRWDGAAGDAELTDESGKWLVQWLVRNGVAQDDLSLAADRAGKRQRYVTAVMILAAMICVGGFVVYKCAILIGRIVE